MYVESLHNKDDRFISVWGCGLQFSSSLRDQCNTDASINKQYSLEWEFGNSMSLQHTCNSQMCDISAKYLDFNDFKQAQFWVGWNVNWATAPRSSPLIATTLVLVRMAFGLRASTCWNDKLKGCKAGRTNPPVCITQGIAFYLIIWQHAVKW